MIVLFALGAVALVGFVGLVLMAGLLYWDQRDLQINADGAALAGALQINKGDCPTTTDYTPIQFADQQLTQDLNNQGLNLQSNLPTQGSWTCGSAVLDNFKNASDGSASNYTASYTYPWNNKPYEVNVTITRSNVTLPFDLIGSLAQQGTVSVLGRAVAQHNLATVPDSFALFVQNGANCQGAGGPKINTKGSIYSDALLTSTGNCAIWAHQTTAFDGSLDYGDILVYPDGQTWAAAHGCPNTTLTDSICADGWELSGHITPTCGVSVPPTPPQTAYLLGSSTTNPDPCAGVPPDVPNANESSYQGTDPNLDSAIDASVGGQCSPVGQPDGSGAGRSGVLTIGGHTYGYGPAPTSTAIFSPGCYGYLDLGVYAKYAPGLASTPIMQFKPGFYYFNGYNAPGGGAVAGGGGGLCMSKQSMILLGSDVSFEFVNGTSFSTSACVSAPTNACGNSTTCDVGYAIPPPTAGPTATASGTAAGMIAGTYTFSYTYKIAGPLATPTAAAASGGSLATGTYQLGYTYVIPGGETAISPYSAGVTLTPGNQSISVGAVTVPTWASGVKWYFQSGDPTFGFTVQNSTGGAFTLNTAGNGAPAPFRSNGETTTSNASSVSISAGQAINLSITGAPTEATSASFYLTSCTCVGVNPGYLGTAQISGGNASLAFNSPTQGNYVQPPSSNTDYLWFASPPTSPEPAPPAPTVAATAGVATNLPAGTYQIATTYVDPEGETMASPNSPVTISAGQDITITANAAPQGVTEMHFYITSAPVGANTGLVGQIAAPYGTSGSFIVTGAQQGNNAATPSTNTTSSAWCSSSRSGWTSSDAAICSNHLIWAPPNSCNCPQPQNSNSNLAEISGTFYLKGPSENSAIMGDVYWPGPGNSQPNANQAGCNYDANGIGGIVGQVVCDSLFVQGGASAGQTTIGYTAGATYSNPPEISLIE